MNKNLLKLASIVMLCPTLLFAQKVEVKVDPNAAQHFENVKSLEREKFFNMHESPSGSSIKADMDRVAELGATMGRGTMSPFAGSSVVQGVTDDQIRESAQRWLKSFKQKGMEITPDVMKGTILVSHATPKHSAGGKYALHWKGEDADYTDEAKFAERWFRITFKENGLELPTYYEPMNEPFVKSNDYDGVKPDKVIKEMCRYHQQMAAHLKPIFPEMKIGGFGGAWPLFEGFNSDFVHWRRRMQNYIDIAGKDSDFLSFHIYDGRNVAGEEAYRSGSNMEALMDIVEGYTFIKFGKPKPILISEHGLTHKKMCGYPYTRERDWTIIEALNHQSVQFMLRPANTEKVIPFILVRAEWGAQNGHPYPWVLQRKDGNGGWLDTDLYKYFEFWQDLKGDYIFSKSSEIDVLSMALADEKRLQIILNNLEEDQMVDLSIAEVKGNSIKKLTLKSIYGEGKAGNIKTVISNKNIKANDLKNIKVRKGETMILTAEYAKSIKPQGELCSKRFYATTYLKPIKAGVENSFELNIDKGEIAGATLKIGVARPSGVALDPVLKVGGKEYPFPTDWKGYDQKNRTKEGFFGTIDVEVNPADLKEKNIISLQFPADSGTISTVGVDVNYKK